MKYYKTPEGDVRIIGEEGDVDGDQSSLVQPSWVLMTAEEIELFIHPPKTPEQIEAEKWEQFDTAWNNLKIGYSTILKTTFQAKFGSELGTGYIATTLYNADTLLPISNTDHVYKCSRETLVNLLQEKDLLTHVDSDYWKEEWGYFETNVIEITSVFLAIAPIKKQLIIDLFGEV